MAVIQLSIFDTIEVETSEDIIDELSQAGGSYEPNRERADNWFQGLGLQLPSDKTNYGSIGNVTYSAEKINISGKLFSEIARRRPK